ncbi:TadE/TadG family type IV pilus assembly protein [Evansella tamaricis]|uniref:Pilus assembly protein n=1 Tax=Evansella tamaricis TaxID=2069301 RepID=A0ABS6JMD0_9BACI|nr:TadE/TadG family type IV pilus assembly protein [Evansella tamaricis]MBU9714007.1 pilus assembly protein [Evansella tamaricis]
MIRSEKGQSLVEFALVIPILLILIVGIVDVGRMLYTYSSLHFTAQETVRLGGLGNEDNVLRQFARDNFTAGDSSNLTVLITPDQGSRVSGNYVTVTLQYTIDPITPFASVLLSDSILLVSDSTIRIE